MVKGEEFSLYGAESESDPPTMDQITPLIDACADLSYRLDAHARLCVQYTADQVTTTTISFIDKTFIQRYLAHLWGSRRDFLKTED